MVGVEMLQMRRLIARVEPLEGELADRLEHPVPRPLWGSALADKALVDESVERVRVGAAHDLGRLECATPGEDREASEEALFVGRQEVVGPVDCCAQCLLARVGLPIALQEVKSLRKPLEQLVGAEEPCTARG